MPPPDNEPDEATFRWYLYKIFGRMMEIGAADAADGGPSGDDLTEFRELMDSLEEYRRPDTGGFIDAVLRSTAIWLADTSTGPWIRSYEFEALGPSGLEEIQWIWGREAAMWGAYLDGEDLREIKRDLARRSLGSGDAVGAVPEPVAADPVAADPGTASQAVAGPATEGAAPQAAAGPEPSLVSQSAADAPVRQPVAARRAKGAAKPPKGASGSTGGAGSQTPDTAITPDEGTPPGPGGANAPAGANAQAGAGAPAQAARSTRGRSARVARPAAGQK
jgi:hypothetical protein